MAHPAYSPDAELSEDGKATVTIMFNYNTDDEKEWFDGINRLQLVEYNENKNTINSDLVFDRAKDVAHGSGRVGELTIKSGQGNFTNNGRYYVRVESKAGTSALGSDPCSKCPGTCSEITGNSPVWRKPAFPG